MDLSPNLTAARVIQNQRYYWWTTSCIDASIDVHELQVWSILIGGFCPSSISQWFLSHKLWHSTATPGHLHLQIPRRCNGSICLKSPLKGLEIQDASHRCTWAPIEIPKLRLTLDAKSVRHLVLFKEFVQIAASASNPFNLVFSWKNSWCVGFSFMFSR